LVFKPLMTLSS